MQAMGACFSEPHSMVRALRKAYPIASIWRKGSKAMFHAETTFETNARQALYGQTTRMTLPRQ